MSFTNTKLQEFNTYLKNKKIAIIGLGVSNLPLIDYLYNLNAQITVFDKRNETEIDKEIIDKLNSKKIALSLGKSYLSKLKGFDVIFRSPSCRPDTPEIQAEVKRGARLTSEIEMVLELTPSTTIAVTGSDGKTTTTSIIYEILKENGFKCFLGGNIGIPLFTKISEMQPKDYVVLELSSFQLMNMKKSPNIAVITNITPNHLDIHKSYEEYIEAKKNIFKYQSEADTLVLNYTDEISSEFSTEAKGKVVYFSKEGNIDNGFMLVGNTVVNANTNTTVCTGNELYLRGRHNLENVCAALAATRDLVKVENAVTAIKNFKGVEHRLEFVREIAGVKWYNDAIGTSPTRTIAGLNSFEENIILIAGGYDKNLDYAPLAKPIVKHVGSLILFGKTSEKIYKAVKTEDENENVKIYKVDNMEEAVHKAKKVAKTGDVVLLSPASASFDFFKNFMEKGRKFKELVNLL